jgi:hypothetical protein
VPQQGLESRIGRRPTAERPKVIDAGPARRMLAPAEKTWELRYGFVVAFSIAGAPAVDVALLGVSHSFAARSGRECGATARSARSIKRGDHASRGS